MHLTQLRAKNLLLFLCLIPFLGNDQPQSAANPYGLKIIATPEDYRRIIQADPDQELLDIQKSVPGAVLDIRYATDNNFTGQAVYPQARAFARKPAILQLQAVQEELKAKNLGVKIYDAYRPYAVTLKFYAVYPDPCYVADPKQGSRHNRGAAIDLTLIDLTTGQEVKMPSGYDDFTERAHPDYQGASDEEKANRALLMDVMTRNGFNVYPTEWWHYDLANWERFELTDLSFEQLDAMNEGK